MKDKTESLPVLRMARDKPRAIDYGGLTNATGEVAAAALKTEPIHRYLLLDHWQAVDAWDDIMIYRRPKEERDLSEIVLPKHSDDELYASYLWSAVKAFARYKKVPADAALGRLLHLENDRVVFSLLLTDKGVHMPLRGARLLTSAASEAFKLELYAEFGGVDASGASLSVFVPVERNGRHVAVERLMRTVIGATDDKGLTKAIMKGFDGQREALEISVEWSPLFAPSSEAPSRVIVTQETTLETKRRVRDRKPARGMRTSPV